MSINFIKKTFFFHRNIKNTFGYFYVKIASINYNYQANKV